MRFEKLDAEQVKNLTPLKAIRQKCLDCSGFQPKEVRLCPAVDCPLFQYRFGRNPHRKGIGRHGKQFLLEKRN